MIRPCVKRSAKGFLCTERAWHSGDHVAATLFKQEVDRWPNDMPAVPDGHFRCRGCGQVFKKGWSDDEAEAEAAANGVSPNKEKDNLVCEDCFQALKAGLPS